MKVGEIHLLPTTLRPTVRLIFGKIVKRSNFIVCYTNFLLKNYLRG